MGRLEQDIRIALRGFLRTPSFTITAILILAIGIGMAVAMFTVYDAVLVRNLPVREQDRIVELYTYKTDPKTDYYLLRGDLRQVAAESRTMRDIAAVAHWGSTGAPMLDGDHPLVINRTLVSGNFFDVLGARPLQGRLLQPNDERPGAAPVLVLSYGIWMKMFGGDPHVVGHRLLEPYTGQHFEIVGVAPPGLDYPSGAGFWMPIWQPSDGLSVLAVARLQPGATVHAAQSEFFTLMDRLFPDRQFRGARARTLTDAVVGNVRPVLLVLASAVGLLLLIACVNVGNLLLLRAASRARELSIRRALGASLGAILRQLIAESALLGLVGGVLGLATASLLIEVLIVAAPPKLPRIEAIAVTGAPLTMALVVTLAAVFVFGVFPSLAGARADLGSPLRFDSRAGRTTRAGRQTRRALVAVQVALALIMLVGAGLLARSLARLQSIDLGYNPDHLALLDVSFSPNEFKKGTTQIDQKKLNLLGVQLTSLWRGIPGVTGVSPTVVPPFLGSGVFTGPMYREGDTEEQKKGAAMIPATIGGSEYFRVLGIPILRGRGFTEADRDGAAEVAVISQAIAKQYWPNEDPIGRRIQYWSADTATWRTIVGIAGDIHWRSLREVSPTIYIPWQQSFWQGGFAIRTSGELGAVLPAIRRVTNEVNPVLSVWNALPMNELLAGPLAQPRLGALLLGGFGIVSMLLAAIGLYGIMASVVGASTRELGVRAALGASPARLRRSVIGEALGISAVGAGAGLFIALGGTRLLTMLLFEVSPTDPLSIVGAMIVLLVVAVVAAYVPARRATQIDPVEALRAD